MKKEPYQCMKQHFSNKKPCPAVRNDIDLSEEIKKCILENRVYHLPKREEPKQIINNIQNVITNMDFIDKFARYTQYNNIKLIDFEDKVEEEFSVISQRLDEDKYRWFSVKTNDILEIIDKISSIPENKFEHLNIIYDNQMNKLQLYECGCWKSTLIDQGISLIVSLIKDYYLDSYECFLLRKIKSNLYSAFDKQKARELVIEYFKFLACFELDPFCLNANDGEILHDDQFKDSYDMNEEFYPLYKEAMDTLSKSEINKIKRSILDIVKRNSNKNVSELNKILISLLHMDSEFKHQLLNS